MLNSVRRWRHGVALLLVLATLAPMGCATLSSATDGPATEASANIIRQVCQTFVPITYSRNDTEETKQQVREHNAAWTELCA